MDKNVVSKFNFINYKITKLNYIDNTEFCDENSVEIEFDITTKIGISEDNKNAKIELSLIIFDEPEKNNYPFSIEIVMEGYFMMESNYEEKVSKNELYRYCKINGTATLFPYLRAAVSDITRICNVTPLVLPLINIYNLVDRSKVKKRD